MVDAVHAELLKLRADVSASSDKHALHTAKAALKAQVKVVLAGATTNARAALDDFQNALQTKFMEGLKSDAELVGLAEALVPDKKGKWGDPASSFPGNAPLHVFGR